ncbi:MAG: ABC transporter ATP-binding protein [Thermodesulfobacteriota bacterium]
MNGLLNIKQLNVSFALKQGKVHVLEDISLKINSGETVGLVGESGCGKSMLALSILQLLPQPLAKIAKGEILFKGLDIAQADERQMQGIRGNDISMIFQEPMTSLNPVLKCGEQVAEVLRLHRELSAKTVRKKVLDLFKAVGISDSERRYQSFPHQMSGGMRQRVGIAMALACNPELILADEPTTALDVTIQAHILNLIKRMQDKTDAAVLFITHDLGLAAQNCSRVAVMYSGWIVEEGDVKNIFSQPLHPYTKGLLASLPRLEHGPGQNLSPIPGNVPDLKNLPNGCLFHPRCPAKRPECEKAVPPVKTLDTGQMVKCWLYGDQT